MDLIVKVEYRLFEKQGFVAHRAAFYDIAHSAALDDWATEAFLYPCCKGALIVCTSVYFSNQIRTELALAKGWWSFRDANFAKVVEHLPSAIEDLTQRGYTNRSISYRQRLAQSYLALHRYDDALPHYLWLAQSTSPDSKAHFVAALDDWSKRRWPESRLHLSRAETLEPGCAICVEASKTLEDASLAHRSITEAQLAQSRALEQMTGPATCLAYIATVTGASIAASQAPSLAPLIRAVGATKQMTQSAIQAVEMWLIPQMRRELGKAGLGFCPERGADDAIYKSVIGWVDVVPYVKESRQAAAQVWELGVQLVTYGQAFNAERSGAKQLVGSDAMRETYWARISAESVDPASIHRGLASVATPSTHAPAQGLVEWTLDKIDPRKWF